MLKNAKYTLFSFLPYNDKWIDDEEQDLCGVGNSGSMEQKAKCRMHTETCEKTQTC